MTPPFTIEVYDNQQLVSTDDYNDIVELGRSENSADALFAKRRNATGQGWRLNIAKLMENTISRNQLRIEPLPAGRIRVVNPSTKNELVVNGSKTVRAGESHDVALPAMVAVGAKQLRIREAPANDALLRSLIQPTMVPGHQANISSTARDVALNVLHQQDNGSLMAWLRGIAAVLQSASSSTEFFQQAARAAVDLVGLDSGRVLLYEQGQWTVVAEEFANESLAERRWQPSQHILNNVHSERKSSWQAATTDSLHAASLQDVKAVVAAPIVNRSGEVVGVLYGDRRHNASKLGSSPISEIEALLVETLAGGVAAGLSRLDQEKAAVAAQVQFEQFFTPELSRQLSAQPDLLKGREADVTCLFCDIRGFSRISERLGSAATVEWIFSTMSALSDCVGARQGVLVDYTGDELMAMWGAPSEQPDHAARACLAALDMFQSLHALNEQWLPRIGEPIRVGIGINSGRVQVGNTGSTRKFKYGPLGNTVNLGSRVQGMTKHLKTEILITAETQKHLDRQQFLTRRIGKARVVNIMEPVELFELATREQKNAARIYPRYEEALQKFDAVDLHSATRILGELLVDFPNDGPSLVLLSRAVNFLISPETTFDPIWTLRQK